MKSLALVAMIWSASALAAPASECVGDADGNTYVVKIEHVENSEFKMIIEESWADGEELDVQVLQVQSQGERQFTYLVPMGEELDAASTVFRINRNTGKAYLRMKSSPAGHDVFVRNLVCEGELVDGAI